MPLQQLASVFVPLIVGVILGWCGLWALRYHMGPRPAVARPTAQPADDRADEAQAPGWQVVDALPTAVVVVDAETHTIVHANQAALELGGWQAAELLGTGCEKCICATSVSNCPLIASQSGLHRSECHMATSGGQRIPISKFVATVSAGGRPYIIETLMDVVDRRRAEELLSDARSAAAQSDEQYKDLIRLRKAVDYSEEAIFIMDLNGTIEYINPGFTKLYGFTPEDCVGKTPRILKSGTMSPERYEHFWHTILSKQVVRGELVNKHKDGRLLDVEGSANPILDEQGEIIGFVAVQHDIMKRKAAEQELRAAKEAAEAAMRAKSEFLANMSHEIRTPMNGVIGMTGLLLGTALTVEQRECVEIIRSSGDSLLSVINDILDFSKIDSGKLELECLPFDLPACVEESLDLFAAQAADKGIELAYMIEQDVPHTIRGDAARLRQVLANLVANAIKFTQTGEVVVAVDVANQGPDVSQIHFAVRDTGIGIPPSAIHRLFESFTQLDASTTRRYGGTGLGLTICKRLSEMMGGQIWAESEGVEGQGSVFHFTIQATAVPSHTRIRLPSDAARMSGKRLLVVDDNATNRRILAGQAAAWDMAVWTAASGAEALTWLRAGERYDVAILDMQMPDMDGLTLAHEIRQLPGGSALPLILLTSVGLNGNLGQLDQLGFVASLSKPVKGARLLSVVMHALTAPANRGAEARPTTPTAEGRLGERCPLAILVAEDNPINQKVAIRMLSKLGYCADAVGSGGEVLEALRQRRYDLVLMDVQMPEMDGLEATRHIVAAAPGGRRPIIIAMTAAAMKGDRELCLAAGMNAYISKPVRSEELAACLEQWGAQRVG